MHCLAGTFQKRFDPKGKRVLIVGTGGVGSAIAASLAGAQVGEIGLTNRRHAAAEELSRRLRTHYPQVETRLGSRNSRGYDLVVNATSLGMQAGDPLPIELDDVESDTYDADVVNMKAMTPFLTAARDRGCTIQDGSDMLFEMVRPIWPSSVSTVP